MTPSVDTLTAWTAIAALTGCFAVFARASYGHFRQKASIAHGLVRVASVLATLGFATVSVVSDPAPIWSMLLAISLAVLSAVVFLQAVSSAEAGVLHVAFAPGQSARLVQEGIYRRVRNPFYSAYLVYWGAWIPMLQFSWLGIAGFLGFLVIYWIATLREETQLSDQFGAAYDLYRRRTGRFWPKMIG